MRCDEAQQLISAGIDGELSRTNADELREHTQACASCAGVAADFRQLSQQLKSAGREILPARLESRVRLALTEVAADAPFALVRRKPWLRQLADIFIERRKPGGKAVDLGEIGDAGGEFLGSA